MLFGNIPLGSDSVERKALKNDEWVLVYIQNGHVIAAEEKELTQH